MVQFRVMAAFITLVSMGGCAGAFLRSDWILFVILSYSLAIMILPRLRGFDFDHSSGSMTLLFAGTASYLAVNLLTSIADVSGIPLNGDSADFLLISTHCLISYAAGIMTATVLDRRFGFGWNRTWYLLFGVMFCMVVACMSMLMEFTYLWVSGIPVFDNGFSGSEAVRVNGQVMWIPTVFSVVSVFCALLARAVFPKGAGGFAREVSR